MNAQSGQTSSHARRSRLAVALWCVLAFLVWNVVFDRVLVLAGRRYVHAATVAAGGGAPYLLLHDWMRAARLDGVRLASLSAAAVLAVALVAVPLARRRDERRDPHP
jgi:hypothetical protein